MRWWFDTLDRILHPHHVAVDRLTALIVFIPHHYAPYVAIALLVSVTVYDVFNRSE